MEIEDWIIEVNQKIENVADITPVLEQWKKRSIYLLPAHVTDLDDKAYKPQVVSLGPYHHGKQHLKPMEEHKDRALLHFLKRSNKPLQSYILALGQVAEYMKDAYDQLDPVWQDDTNRFLKLMVLDGCFILEILRMESDDYAPNDPVFSKHGQLYILPFIKCDMLLLENQVPLLVLYRLLAVENRIPEAELNEYVNKLIFRFRTAAPVRLVGKCLHLLDVYRKGLFYADPRRPVKRNEYEEIGGGVWIIPSATELHKAGIRFKNSKSTSLMDISFQGKTLNLPVMILDYTTKTTLLNLIAFERFHIGAGNEVFSYICFLDNLIKGYKDVSLLKSHGIIYNALGSDEDVVKLFKLFNKYIALDPASSSLDTVYRGVHQKLRKRFQRMLKEWEVQEKRRKRLQRMFEEWRADFMRTYFRSPWALVSVIAAIFLFTLSTIQTIYSVLSYVHRNS